MPAAGSALAYLDFGSMEFGVADGFSQAPAMLADYRQPGPFLSSQTRTFGTPHYSTVAAIARIALNKSNLEITVKMVRDADRHTKAVSAAHNNTPSAL
jgi:hypothetical protein